MGCVHLVNNRKRKKITNFSTVLLGSRQCWRVCIISLNSHCREDPLYTKWKWSIQWITLGHEADFTSGWARTSDSVTCVGIHTSLGLSYHPCVTGLWCQLNPGSVNSLQGEFCQVSPQIKLLNLTADALTPVYQNMTLLRDKVLQRQSC